MIPAVAKADFMSDAHVCRHTDGGDLVSADLFEEQTYIRQGKGAGGLKVISINAEQVAVWVNIKPVYDLELKLKLN